MTVYPKRSVTVNPFCILHQIKKNNTGPESPFSVGDKEGTLRHERVTTSSSRRWPRSRFGHC